MARKSHPAQIAFDFTIPEVASDPVQACRDAGIFNALGNYDPLHGTVQDLSVPYTPRSFSFPVRLYRDERSAQWMLDLSTPAMESIPLVRRIAKVTGIEPQWRSGPARYGQWHHAVDLATDKGIARLLSTQEHTIPKYTLRAIGFGLHTGELSTKEARRALGIMGIPEPFDRSAKMLAGDGLRVCRTVLVPVIDGDDPGVGAWGNIHAIEDGWITKPRPGKHGRMTEEGWRRRGETPPAPFKRAA